MGDDLLHPMSAKDRAIAAALIVAIAASILFIIAYAFGGSRLYEGLALALATGALAATAIGWAFWILAPEEVVEERDEYPSTPQDRKRESAEWQSGEREITRRRTLTRLLYAALGVFGVALIVPVRSLGNGPDGTLFHTKWRRGSRLVRENGSYMRINDLNVDSVVTVFPEGAADDAQSQTVLIRLPDGVAGSAHGYIAYSKICTHAGCAVALYRALGAERIDLDGAPRPGLAMGRLRLPGRAALPLVTKAGGFGPPELFVSLAREAVA